MSEASLFWKGETFTKSNLTTLLCSYCENHRHWSTKRCLVCRQYALQQSRVPRRCRQRDRFLWEEEKEVQSVRRHGQHFEWKDTFVGYKYEANVNLSVLRSNVDIRWRYLKAAEVRWQHCDIIIGEGKARSESFSMQVPLHTGHKKKRHTFQLVRRIAMGSALISV